VGAIYRARGEGAEVVSAGARPTAINGAVSSRERNGEGKRGVEEMKGVDFQGSVGGEPMEEQRDGRAGDARRQRDLWLVAAIWQRRETEPVCAGAGPSGLRRPIGQLDWFGWVGRREEVGRLQGLKKGKRDGLPGKVGSKRKLGCRNRIQIWIQGFRFKSNSFKHFQTNFELDFKIG
jgi:hypothetical protein